MSASDLSSPAGADAIVLRVRAAASADTDRATLLALAGDPAVTVRAALALNPSASHNVAAALAGDGDERVRTLLARRLSALIPSLSQDARDRLQDQALTTLSVLVEDEAERVRATIADVLKSMPQAPRQLILSLAHDRATAVCDPVIRLSPLLTPEDLMALVASAPSPSTATAVARRPDLSEAVSDAIAATADTAAIRALLANQSAAIRESTLDALIARAGDQETWHEPLVRRPTLTGRAAIALSEIVASQLLDELAQRGDLDPAITRELSSRLADRMKPSRPVPDKATMEHAMAQAKELYADDALNEDTLLGAVHRGEVHLATAMLAVAAEVPPSVIDRAATLRSAKGLVSLVWKAGFSMRVAGPLQTMLAQLAPSSLLGPSHGGNFPLAADEMRWQLDFLTRMGR